MREVAVGAFYNSLHALKPGPRSSLMRRHVASTIAKPRLLSTNSLSHRGRRRAARGFRLRQVAVVPAICLPPMAVRSLRTDRRAQRAERWPPGSGLILARCLPAPTADPPLLW
jgi:hypothetical protein